MNAEQNLGPISPYVYGTNYGPNFFVPLQMQDAVKDARITFITFPDANWGRQNDLDEWQLDQFVHLCRQWGAEPRIIVRLFGGTAEKAAAVVKYVNLTKGYNVRYWGVGSEPNLYRDYELERYLDEWRTWAEAMRSVDPSIILLGPDVNQFEVRPNGATNQKAYDFTTSIRCTKASGRSVCTHPRMWRMFRPTPPGAMMGR